MTFYKSILILWNDTLQDSFQSISQNLCDVLVNATYPTNRTEVFNLNNPTFLGIREMKVAFKLTNLPHSWNSRNTFTPSLMTFQQDWKKAIKKPFGPGALFPFKSFTTLKTSIFSKDRSNQTASSLSHLLLFGVLLYTSCMLRGAFTLLIKFSTYLSKKN